MVPLGRLDLCLIQLAPIVKTALPANINDEDLVEGQPLRPRPLSERTSLSYQLSRLRFAEISQRQIWQANASPHPPYSFM
jgi:hypothetical protein